MKGKDGEDRDCRAKGGHVEHHVKMHHGEAKHARGGHANAVHKNVIAEFHGAQPDNEPDDALKRGGSIHHKSHRLFRRRGGKASEYTEEKTMPEEGGEKKGGRVHRKRGGHIDGEGHRPHMGRAGRRSGGKTSADLHPITHDAGHQPFGVTTMRESEKTP